MSSKSTKKSKKPLQTTLGKAAIQAGEKVDLSNVGKTLHTSIFGLSQLLALRQSGTEEVLSYVDNECDLIFECRVCRSLFRSFANFILHKREYCRELFNAVSQYSGNFSQNITILKDPDENQNKETVGATSSPVKNGITLASVIEKLKEKTNIQEFTSKVLNEDLSEVSEVNSNVSTNMSHQDLLIEQIGNNNVAVFQTLIQSISDTDESKNENMKSQVMEIHTIMGKDEAVLGPTGNLFNLQASDKSATSCKTELICQECKLKFATRKTLTYHIKYKHNKTRRVFICPDCKGHFANAWSVYRHLYKVHRRTAGYIKKMREHINNSVISKEAEPAKKKEKMDCEKIESTDEENQWLNNIEGDKDFQMCGGCGKRFERKAALHSHAQMCTKRIAVCNSIKENSAKRKEEETKDKNKTQKVDKVCSLEPAEIPKGASKRKPYLLRTYKKPSDVLVKITEENVSDICDVNANSKIVEINCDISSKVGTESSSVSPGTTSVNSHSESPDENLNTSDNSDNFKGFNRECTVESEKIKTENEESVTAKESCWNKLNLDGLSFSVQSGKSMTNNTLRDSEQRNSSLSTLSGKITLRSLEDLIGISQENVSKKLKFPITENAVPAQNSLEKFKSFELRHDCKNYTASDSIKANVSPKMLRSKDRPSKRKRSVSYDTSPRVESKKSLQTDSFGQEQDINFVEKASPFMDKKKLLCKPCKKTYPTFAKLLWHMSGHFSWFRFQCSRCSFISFSKSDCSKHAKLTHNITLKELPGVVMPIPNWKIALMSHDFSEFNEENDLTGKHTDEVIIECDEENDQVEEDKNKGSDNEDVKIIGTLFVDAEGNEDSCLLPTVNGSVQIKNEIPDIDEERRDEIIDMVEETNDSFLIEELPEEMYTMDKFEIISDASDFENRQFRVFSHEKDEDIFDNYYIPKSKDLGLLLVDGIKKESIDSFQQLSPVDIDVEKEHRFGLDIKINGTEREEDNSSKKIHPDTVPFVNTRPARNRTRSIKTRDEDFLYDMNKPFKLTEAPNVKSNNIQKIKKCPNFLCPKPKTSPPKNTKIS